MAEQEAVTKTHFIRRIIDEDIAQSKNEGKVITRFPPEPNGYLHIGHAKSICLNFGIAQDYQRGPCFLRFDDTNPEKESQEFQDAIACDVHWLGFDWQEHQYFTSNYFEQLYQIAVHMIKAGNAYVCDLSAEEVREYRGTLTAAGKDSPYRNRTVEENLDLFEKMRAGEFADGSHTPRAKIDMSSGNINLRDPALYRIRKVNHHRTGNTWCIYPMYDFAHALSDAIEGITHSLCTLEFQDHRPLYDWCVANSGLPHTPQQIEFSRLNLNYTITSKRKLKQLVDEKLVQGWDDPRMPTLSGLRRRGFTPAAIRNFCETIGVSKQDSIIDMSILEEAVRDDLNVHAPRRMAVLDPLKITITNYPEDQQDTLTVSNHPQQPEMGKRDIPFSKTLYIEREDFNEEPPKKYRRLSPGKEVRLLYAYIICCDEVIKGDNGQVIELRCSYYPETLGGKPKADGKKVKGIIHWVSANHAVDGEVRVYDRLFKAENPAALEDFHTAINPDSLQIIQGAKLEPSLKDPKGETHFQFNRLGYFCTDSKDHNMKQSVFNRIVSLRDTWSNS